MFENFKNEWLGKRIDYDHVYGYQCVDLILQYIYENFGIGGGVWGNAIDYWTKTSAPLFDKFDKIESSDGQQGDIVILNGHNNPFGHIGIATGNITGDTIEILEQNGQTGSGDGQGGNLIRTRFVSRSRVAGLLRPKGQAPPAPAAQPAQADVSGKDIFLPSAAGLWRVYPLDKVAHVGNEVGRLSPESFPPGLTYHILGNPSPYVFTIQTDTFGQVNIWGGPDTIAEFHDPAPAPPEPAPAPPAPAPEVVTPPAPATSNIVYTRFETPLNLVVTRDPTHVWHLDFVDDAHANSAVDLPVNTPFLAVGKAQRTDGDKPTYYMDADSFGSADTTGVPNRPQGINVADLLAASAPAAPSPITTGTTNPDETKVDVKVIPTDPNKWKSSFIAGLGPVLYIANTNVVVTDLDGQHPEQQLVRGMKVSIGGVFEKDGIKYYRTQKSVETDTWYGIPLEALTRNGSDDILDDIDLILSEVSTEAKKVNFRDKRLIAIGGTVDGFFLRLLKTFGFGRKKNK